jgi:hypothetical protein
MVAVVTGYEAKWPFLFVVNARGESVRWAVVGSRLVSPSRQAQLVELRRSGFRFLGMTSDGAFPLDAQDDPLDYLSLCEAWCHCFREADAAFPETVPRISLSLSDFTDGRRVSPERAASVPGPTYDLVYVCANEPWKRAAKNWDLAQRCIPVLCAELGLRALIVCAPPDAAICGRSVTAAPALPWDLLLGYIARARFLFVPNAADASPRVLAEALCLDRPILVHRNILGGWHYVNAFTGAFFGGVEDVVAAARKCLAVTGSPRRWFRANHGPELAGARLLALVRALDPGLRESSRLALADRLSASP